MKKVLIITYYWPPAGGGGVQRWVKFVKYLRDFGWEPLVYTVQNGDYPILDNTLGQELPDDITVIKQPITEPYTLYKKWTGKGQKDKIDANFLSQGKKMGWKDKFAVWVRGNFFIPDARCLWIRPSVRFLKDYLKKNPVDAIISSGPPHSCHLIAYGLKASKGLPWVIDYRDPWTQIDFFNDLGLTSIARKRHVSLEKKVLNACDCIITVGKTMALDLLSLTDKRTEVITNGFDETDRSTVPGSIDRQFTLTYIGTMNDARNPEVLWKALHQLKKNNHNMVRDIRVNLIGKPEQVVIDSVKAYNLEDKVHFGGYVSHKEAIGYQNSAHVLLLIINRTSNNKSILTGKIFEYIASGRPILCIGPRDGDASEIIYTSGAGTVLDYDDTDGLIKFLEVRYDSFLTGKIESSGAVGIEKYSRRFLTGRLAAVLDGITGRGPDKN